ncbi:MAG: FtsX-like permease family protein [Acidimicrobiia bacterium]|nr:FtsX-like permease family protein [Acidimicrobiia bacterium]
MVSAARGRLGRFWLRWSWRDFRARWVAVVAIALVLAIGTGVYAGLGSTGEWRRQSNDASFAALSMHDLRVTLSPGTFTEQGGLVKAVEGIEAASTVTGVVERLVVDSQVDTGGIGGIESVLVPARLVGMTFGLAQPVDSVWVRDGTAPVDDQPGLGAAVMEAKFADIRGLPTQGSVTVAGGHTVPYTGVGTAPEDFFYEGPEGTIAAEGELAILYLALAAAQDISGHPGMVNDIVLTLADGADRDVVEAQLAAVISDLGLSGIVSTRDDSDAVRVLYEDIDNDQQFWNALSALVLAAAALAAFNLISRIVEAQRREIGIGMALGVPRRQLAIRPLMIGTQVALLGTVAGLGVGLVVGNAFGSLLESVRPLPEHRTPFQFGLYAQAAALGIVIPIAASLLPVWRALRVEPIEAIRTGHLTAKTSRLTSWTSRIRLPGSTMTQMPIRNVLRTPRRAMLTAVGVGAAITALVAVLGMLDSFDRANQEANDEFTKGDPDRVVVQLDTFYPSESAAVSAIRDAPSVDHIDAGLRLPATALAADPDANLDLLVELVDLDQAVWTPTIEEVSTTTEPSRAGILLARKAADDLAVDVGGSITLRHPIRTDAVGFALAETEFVVRGIHANPLRTFAFVDLDDAGRFGLKGAVNLVHVYPTEVASRSDVQRAVFGLAGVTSSQPVARISEAIDEALDQFLSFLFVTAAAVMTLALLIAFNSSRIAVEERQREHATMRAFGLPVRAVIGVVVKESVIIGIVATGIGIGGGFVFLRWMLASLARTTLPDVGIDAYISPATIGAAAIVGILAVAAAPLFLARRIQHMNLPDTLRVME